MQTQAESIQHREELLQEMEAVNQMTAREARTEQESRVKRTMEIESQVVSVLILYCMINIGGYVHVLPYYIKSIQLRMSVAQ